MIRRDGYVKVLDFGLAKLLPVDGGGAVKSSPTRERTRVGAVVGTPNYMAPEQALGAAVDTRADVYSVCVVLHEMLTGKLPFAADTEGTPPPIDAGVARALRRGLAVDPAARYQSLDELVAGLERPPAAPRRPRSVASLVAAAVVVAVIGWIVATRPFSGHSPDDDVVDLAVLPFDAVGLAAGEEYLGVGMADALTTQLGSLPQFNVRPTSSILARRSTMTDPLDVARALQVEYALSGLIQRYEDRVRVTVQLIAVAAPEKQWTERVDGRFTDLFQLQDTVARRVAASLSERLGSIDTSRLAAGQTTNADAYTRYLQARYFLSKAQNDDIKRAVGLFREAVALDGRYALAYAGLSAAYRTLGIGAVRGLSPHEAMPLARQAATAALALDPDAAEAYLTLGLVSFQYDWNWREAESALQQAVALSPNMADAHRGYGWFLGAMGRFDEGVGELRRATELDPVSILARENYGVVLGLAGRYAEALEQLQRANEIDPSAPRPYMRRIAVFESMGQYDDAIRAWQEMLRAGGNLARADQVGAVLAAGGYDAVMRYELQRIRQAEQPLDAATLYVRIGDVENAIAFLERALPTKNTWLPFIKVDERFKRLHSHPRFQQVLLRMGL
jgi:serine/threonine-protein kinase